ncbi:cytidylyltransferase domain-containing protein [Clostridium botulinum]|uniref:cytidylyltransferase domain-containing protein n=1 Tax=Clostridium botulinum TaxID=1491 RepID=UPI0006A54D10|nr:glycosyltransferase family protein [Clostridium botulinum]KOC31911.1 3-deoxy-manno-octulosonate cytidylyltransferase [Clostridium botulinum]
MKNLCIVQARMGSSRLPGKVMKKINGYPMIYYTLMRLQESRYIDEVILATSNKDIDTPLTEYVKSLGVKVFRGSEENVLERYKVASDKYKGDVIIRVTGDCPLVDPVVVDNAITKYLMYNYDYLRLDVPNTFVRGFDVEVFSKKALDKVYSIVSSEEKIKDIDYQPFREHVTYYIYNHKDEFNIGYLKGEHILDKEINLSVDTEEDFKRIKEIYNKNSEKVSFLKILNKILN